MKKICFEKYAFFHFFWQILKIVSLETSAKPQMRQWKQNINVLTDFGREKHFFFNLNFKNPWKSPKSEFFSPHLALCSWKQIVMGSVVWRASQSFEVMLSAPFFTWNSWKQLSVSKDHVFCHTVRVCFVTTMTFWHSSAAQDPLKKVKKLATK